MGIDPVSPAAPSPRRLDIDYARGLAVLIMIQAHTLDAWTRPASRGGAAYAWLSLLGGFAAPLFLFLAGLSLVLAAEARAGRGVDRRQVAAQAAKRGLEIFVLAFLFRLQAFVVSPGSWPVTIFRVDILNVMGLALAVAGCAWGLARGRWKAVLVAAVMAAATALITPIVRVGGWVDFLPLWFQWYLRPFGDHTTFTLLPWAGFVFAGAAVGGALAARPGSGPGGGRQSLLLGIVGSAAILVGFYAASLPTIYRQSSFWTSSPTFFLIRVGVLMLCLALCWLLSRPADSTAWRWRRILTVFGSNSLFVYWIHVELVYGYASWAIHRRLPLWGTVAAFVLFSSLMYAAIGWRDDLVRRWGQWRSRVAPRALPRGSI